MNRRFHFARATNYERSLAPHDKAVLNFLNLKILEHIRSLKFLIDRYATIEMPHISFRKFAQAPAHTVFRR